MEALQNLSTFAASKPVANAFQLNRLSDLLSCSCRPVFCYARKVALAVASHCQLFLLHVLEGRICHPDHDLHPGRLFRRPENGAAYIEKEEEALPHS
jgi:hypothetical protein